MTALSHSHIITGACTCALTFKFLHERHWLAIVLFQEASYVRHKEYASTAISMGKRQQIAVVRIEINFLFTIKIYTGRHFVVLS